MAKPWELNWSQTPEKKPWENDWATSPAESQIIQEMPEDVSVYDRMVVKNLGAESDPNAQTNYLQKKYPQYNVTNDKGQFFFQSKDTGGPRRVLDPQDKWNPTEVLMDIGDSAYDLGSGITSGLASAAGGIAGGIATAPTVIGAPLGALSGAASAGGATGAGLEVLRQKLGNMLGIDQQTDKDAIGYATAGGALSPLLFGTGAGGKKVVDAALKSGISKDILQAAQRGATGVGYDYVKNTAGAKMLAGLTGQTARGIQTLGEKLKEIVGLEKGGLREFVEESQHQIKGNINEQLTKWGSKIGDAIRQTEVPITMEEAAAPWVKRIDELKAMKRKPPSVLQELDELEGAYKHLFGEGENSLTGVVSPEEAFGLQQRVKEFARFDQGKGGITNNLTGKLASDNVVRASKDSYGAINKLLDAAVSKAENSTGIMGLKKQYRDWKVLQNEVAPHFSSLEKTYSTMKNINNGSKKLLKENLTRLGDMSGSDTLERAKILEALAMYSNAPTDAISSGGVTSTSRTNALRSLGAGVGALLGNQTTGEDSSGFQKGAAITLGGGLGGFMGAKMASPWFIRKVVEGAAQAHNFGRAIKNKVPMVQSAAPISAWNLLRDERESK